MQQTLEIIVHGKVQGVFYRQSTLQEAMRLGLTGYVKNRPDGSVYILASGTRENLDRLAAWCEEGPPQADVQAIAIHELAWQEFAAFEIIR
jgi:acylphosphatase